MLAQHWPSAHPLAQRNCAEVLHICFIRAGYSKVVNTSDYGLGDRGSNSMTCVIVAQTEADECLI